MCVPEDIDNFRMRIGCILRMFYRWKLRKPDHDRCFGRARDFGATIISFQRLTRLTVNFVPHNTGAMSFLGRMVMPRLEELKIRCGPEYSDQANLMLPGFIRRNRQVKKIYLKFASLNNVVLDAMHLWLDHGAFECLAIQLEVSDDFAMYKPSEICVS